MHKAWWKCLPHIVQANVDFKLLKVLFHGNTAVKYTLFKSIFMWCDMSIEGESVSAYSVNLKFDLDFGSFTIFKHILHE